MEHKILNSILMKKLASLLGWSVLCCVWAQPLIAQETTLRFVLDGHAGGVQSIAVSDDTIVSGGRDGTIKLWDLNSGMERMTLKGHDRFSSVIVSPDGGTVASAGGDGTIKFWNATTGQEEMTMEPGLDPVVTGGLPIAFTPDGQTLASSDNGIIRLWDVKTGEKRANLILPQEANCCVLSIAFGSDGSKAVSGIPGVISKTGKPAFRVGFVVWDLANDQHRLIEGVGPTEYVLSIAVTKDGRTVATGPGGMPKVLRLWDVETGTARSLESPASRVVEVAFSPDDKTLASASWDGTVRLWDVVTGDLLAVLQGLPRFNSVAFSRDGKTLVAAGTEGEGQDWSGQIMVWDLD